MQRTIARPAEAFVQLTFCKPYRLLKAYHGMGTEGQRDDVGSLVVTAKNPKILSAFLKALLEICNAGVIECWVQTNGFDPHLRLNALSDTLTSWEQLDRGVWQAHILH